MLNKLPLALFRYSVAVVAVGLVLLLNQLLWPLIQPGVSSLFLVAVMVSAWYGGLGPGLLATGLADLVSGFFFFTPSVSRLTLDIESLVRFGVFTVAALIISSLTAARKRAEEALRRAHEELEMRVQMRTAELATVNDALRAEITERKETEARLTQVTTQLVERNHELWRLQREVARVGPLAALGRITGTIAHELGTPLNTVLGYTQILLSEGLPDSARESVQIIETQVQRIVNIIQHYLSRTRRAPRERHPTDVNELVRETLVLLEPVFRQHQVQVATRLAETLPSLHADSASLQRVLINLLNNAIDAMNTGGRVVITTRMSPLPETTRSGIVVEVKDTGSGIPPELLPRIFDLFVTTKAPGKGTGLGLIVCQEIVEAHDGTIEISSQFGAGTCVRVFLPIDETTALSPVAEEER